MANRIQLSTDFFLDEFTRSETAARLGRPVIVLPGSPEFESLRRLCADVLQPMRDALGPTHVISGFRPRWLNKVIGGAPTSQHTRAEAADIVVSGYSPYEVCAWLITSGILFDQLIHEFGEWAHVSTNPPECAPRREVLTAYKQPRTLRAPRTAYAVGLRQLRELAA